MDYSKGVKGDDIVIEFLDGSSKSFKPGKEAFKGANLRGAKLVSVDLARLDFRGANLGWADLRMSSLTGVRLEGATLREADLRFVDLRDADLEGAVLVRSELSGADLSGADFSVADLRGADLSGATLVGANLSGADLSWTDLEDADFSGADLSDVDLTGAFVKGAKFKGACLRDAMLVGANLRGVDFSGADLSWANLRDAKLDGVELNGATLNGADFRNSSLIGVELNGVDIRGADFRGADVDTDGLSEAKLSGAKFGPLKDCKTKKNEVTEDRRVSMSLDKKDEQGINDENDDKGKKDINDLSLGIEICLLDAAAVAPKYALAGDAGMDLTSVSFRREYDFVEYDTGVAVKVPEGYVGLVFPRSSISKTGMRLKNGVGVIDSNYRGSIKLRFEYSGKGRMYNVGERIGQLVIMPAPQFKLNTVTFEEFTTEEGEASARGEGAFGSTGHSSFYHVFIMMLVAYAIIAFLGTLTGLGALNGSDVELFSNVPTNWI